MWPEHNRKSPASHLHKSAGIKRILRTTICSMGGRSHLPTVVYNTSNGGSYAGCVRLASVTPCRPQAAWRGNAGDKIPYSSFRCASCCHRNHRRSLWFPSVRLCPKPSGLRTKTGANRRSVPGRQPLARVPPHTVHIPIKPEIDCEMAIAGTSLLLFLSQKHRKNEMKVT